MVILYTLIITQGNQACDFLFFNANKEEDAYSAPENPYAYVYNIKRTYNTRMKNGNNMYFNNKTG